MKDIIYLVEDNEDDIELTMRAFKEANIANKVIIARDGAEALEYLLGNASEDRRQPAVILLDLKLPKIDGLEVLRRIRAAEATRLTRVVVLTSSEQEEDLVNSYRFGCNSFVRKPVAFADFAEAVRQLGLYWLILNEPPPDAEGTAK